MRTTHLLIPLLLLSFMPAVGRGSDLPGPVAFWRFDEGRGDIAADASGRGRDARLHGATWVRDGKGGAVRLDGLDDYVECGTMGVTGPVTVEAWVRPMLKGHGEAVLIGESMSSFVLTYYNAELCYWYIGNGNNNLRGKLTLRGWNHVVGTFDGATLRMWVNGRLVGSEPSRYRSYSPSGQFLLGTKGRPDLPRFNGMIDAVRVYDRALKADEVVAHFKAEAGDYGFDSTWFRRLKVTTYPYPGRGQVTVEAGYRGLQPFRGTGVLEVALHDKREPQNVLQRAVVDPVPDSGVAEVRIATGGLEAGAYVLRATLRDGQRAWPTEEVSFSHPRPEPALASPAEEVVAPLPPQREPTPYGFAMDDSGGFNVTIKGVRYPFRTRVSWPNGEFNHLGAGGKGEAKWKAVVRHVGAGRHEVRAGGAFYDVHRRVDVHPTHVRVRDTYTNRTEADLGLLIYNEMNVAPGQVKRSLLAGFEGRRRMSHSGAVEVFSPSVFVVDDRTGIGIAPVDDVLVVQCVLYAESEAAGVGTERFALGPGKSYTLEWAVYPTGTGDYYDFINAFRHVEGRIGTVDGAPGFITFGPMNRRQVPDESFLEHRAIKYAIIHSLGRAFDDPELSVEGIEFIDYPREMQLLTDQAAVFKRRYPGRKVMFHVAHSLFMTNDPNRFADSKVILADGSHAQWMANVPYVTSQRQNEGWTWWIYYPTPGNSFHDALMRSVDVMMDDMGMDGAFMDGFFAGYQGQWTYDGRWDGHSAEIDPKTKTISRRRGSVLLLSQPSMIEFARRIRDKGGVVIANNTMITRSIANERYMIFDQEVVAGPHVHLAPSVTALAQGPFSSEKEIYLDMLEKLSWGQLFVYYLERLRLTGPSLAARQYPMTFEEIRSGLVRGRQRIVTMNDGVYGWEGDDRLHMVHKFDARGVAVPNDFLSTVDSDGVRTRLAFSENESAVIEPMPVRLEHDGAVNVCVLHYDHDALSILVNGRGRVVLDMFVGTSYPDKRDGVLTDGGMNPRDIGVGAPFRVGIGAETTTIEERDGSLAIPLDLTGPVRVTVERGP